MSNEVVESSSANIRRNRGLHNDGIDSSELYPSGAPEDLEPHEISTQDLAQIMFDIWISFQPSGRPQESLQTSHMGSIINEPVRILVLSLPPTQFRRKVRRP